MSTSATGLKKFYKSNIVKDIALYAALAVKIYVKIISVTWVESLFVSSAVYILFT